MKYGEFEFTFEDILDLLKLSKYLKFSSIPKISKSKVGIVIAVRTENQEEKIRLENDLIENLRKFLDLGKIPPIFNVLILEEKYSKKIIDFESSLKYLKKTRGHLMIYGRVNTRKHEGKDHYLFNLEATVRHATVPQVLQDNLAKEFAELFPGKWFFPKDEELLGFEITHEVVGFVSEYIVAIASYISGDIDLAYKLYRELELKLNTVSAASSTLAIKEIKKRLPLRLVELAMTMNEKLYTNFRKTHDIIYIKQTKEFLDIIKKYKPNDNIIVPLSSIYYFLIENDIDKAIKVLTSVDHGEDITWRYNLAFLFAFRGNLSKAKRQYDKASQGVINPIPLADVEIFLSAILEKYPEKYQLYFIRGYLNYKIKGDMLLAKEDFKQFMDLSSTDEFLDELRLAKIYVKQIENN